MLVRDIVADNTDIYVSDNYINNPVVSIILPTYSRAKSGSLKRAIDSFLAQSYKRFELIIVDDASIDGTFDICREYMKSDNRIKIIRHRRNVGLPAISTYEAYMESRGEYISFGFDDNTWEQDALERTIEFYKKNNVQAGYGITKLLNPDTGDFVYLGQDSEYVEASLFFSNAIGEGSVVLHRDVFENIGLFDPHISLTRICDWDLWQRLIEKYEFISTGIDFATEYGIALADSLGNTRALNLWFVAEYLQNRKYTDFLKPKVYGEINIFEDYSGKVTDYYRKRLEEGSDYYKEKSWFKKSIKHGNLSTVNKKRVIILCFGGISASNMSFTEYSGEDFIFRFIQNEVLDLASLYLADIVVQCRLLPDDNWVVKCCNALKVPIYYYVDDCFPVVFRDEKGNQQYRNTNKNYLERYSGIIVSSHKLVEYYKSNCLHDNVILLPPIMSDKIHVSEKSDQYITIGYMGAHHRENVMLHTVIPAIYSLREVYNIRLVLPDDDALRNCFENDKEINIVWYKRQLNYIRALHEINEVGIDILVHPGEEIPNNQYKTLNCLANAALLDANLVVSNVKPYSIDDTFKDCYEKTENDVDSWVKSIRKIIENKEYADKQKTLAKKSVGYYYSTEHGWKELTDEWMGLLPEKDYIDSAERMLSFVNGRLHDAGVSLANTGYVRIINPKTITYQHIKRARTYRFTPNKECFRSVYLAFAKEQGCDAKVQISICNLTGTVLANASISSTDMVENGITSLRLGREVRTMGEDLIIKIKALYNNKDAELGVFEIAAQRSFGYKCLNKLGLPSIGRNVIWIDVE